MTAQPSTVQRWWLLLLLLLIVVMVLAAFNRLGQPLRRSSGDRPWGQDDGMLALQLAGHRAAVEEITAEWGPEHQLRAGFLLGLDYLFMVAYGGLLTLTCLWSARVLSRKARRFRRVRVFFAGAMWIAVLLDAVENAMVLHQLLHGSTSPWPEVTLWVALIKFQLIGLAFCYSLAGLVAWCLFTAARRMDQSNQTDT